MGRPSSKPKKLKDGYYIEVRNKNDKTGIKIRRNSLSELKKAIKRYRVFKEVEILGQVKKGKLIGI